MNDFSHYNELLLNLGAVTSVSELHGLVCGELVGGKTLTDESWLTRAVDYMDIADVTLEDEQQEHVVAFWHLAQAALADDAFSFSLMLPDDDSGLARRTQELADWCQGFLHGLARSGLDLEGKLSKDTSDAIRDIAQISRAEADDDEDTQEEQERLFVELTEYVKVAALTIRAELAPSSGESASKSNVH